MIVDGGRQFRSVQTFRANRDPIPGSGQHAYSAVPIHRWNPILQTCLSNVAGLTTLAALN